MRQSVVRGVTHIMNHNPEQTESSQKDIETSIKREIRSRLPVKRTRVEIDFHRVSLKGEIVGISGGSQPPEVRGQSGLSAGAQEDL